MTTAIAPRKAAVIDIGSNSVRLVIYEASGSAALPYFNEKVLAGLGRGLTETGTLSAEGVVQALAALRRYRAILEGLGVTQVIAVATAAVREAEDGDDFARKAAAELGAPLRILSGTDEGRLSALGVRVGIYRADGVMGDLGGSSLEFQRVSPGGDDAMGETHLLGPLAMADTEHLPIADRRKAIRKVLRDSKLIEQGGRRFYAVGGAWRALANVHMELTSYPLRVLHGYKMDGQALRQVLKAIISTERDKDLGQKLSSLVGRRFDTLTHAALVLSEVFDMGEFKEIVISANGLRDGVLADSIAIPTHDPLLDGIAAFLRLETWQYAFGETLFDFISPVMPKLMSRDRIYRAACLLADCGGRYHPDHRPDLAYDVVLRAPIPGILHDDRAMLAHAIGCRYSHKFARPPEYVRIGKASDEEVSRILGAAMRLGAVYSGRSSTVLWQASLKPSKTRLTLEVTKGHEAMISETVVKRLSYLANLLDLDAHTTVAK